MGVGGGELYRKSEQVRGPGVGWPPRLQGGQGRPPAKTTFEQT